MKKSLTIVICDDEVGIRHVLERDLRDISTNILQCGSGNALLQSLRYNSVDLIIMDWYIPGGGETLIREIKLKYPNTKIILLSGAAECWAISRLYGIPMLLKGRYEVADLFNKIWDLFPLD